MVGLIKRTLQYLCLGLIFPFALLSGFGSVYRIYIFFAHTFALIPGFPGEFCRAAWYHLTLRECALDVTIGFGSFFSKSGAQVGSHVSIGAFCVIGTACIGEGTQIASHVGIPGGRHQHRRQSDGRLADGEGGPGVVIGSHCWIGESALVMARVGSGSTIGAGAVVVKDIPENAVAVGNPARVLRSEAPLTSNAAS